MTPSFTTIPSQCCPPLGRLDAYFDRELPQPERDQIDSHLQACPICRQALEQIAATSALVQSIELPAMSQMGRARVLRELTESAAAPDRWLLPIRLLTAAAAAVFFLATALIVYQLHYAGIAPGPSAPVQPIIAPHPLSPGSARVLPTATTNPAQP